MAGGGSGAPSHFFGPTLYRKVQLRRDAFPNAQFGDEEGKVLLQTVIFLTSRHAMRINDSL